MRFDINGEERDVLLHMLDEAIREMGPEIRHTMTSTYKDDLKQHRRVLRTLHDRLAAAVLDGAGAPASQVDAAGPLGTA